jgi:hypothetical protein
MNMLIIAGPQGSGNHMWSKIFALHPDVLGWQALLDEYWIGHDREPFAEYWECPGRLKEFDWSQSEHYVTSISLPYMLNGESHMPDIESFAAGVPGTVSLAIIGRDRNVLGMQEKRVRGSVTFEAALAYLDSLTTIYPRAFLSFELLHLYHRRYLRQISNQLGVPVATDDARIDSILREDSNHKYFRAIDHYWVDDLAHFTSRKWR